MSTDLTYIRSSLIKMLNSHTGDLRISADTEEKFETTGTKPAIQGKQEVAGYYFASVVSKPKDIRLYYFPIYTHPDAFRDIPDALRKCLKGKSCFHLKKMDTELEQSIQAMVDKGVMIYKKDGLI